MSESEFNLYRPISKEERDQYREENYARNWSNADVERAILRRDAVAYLYGDVSVDDLKNILQAMLAGDL